MDRLDEHRHVGLIVEFGFDHHWDSTRDLNGEKRKSAKYRDADLRLYANDAWFRLFDSCGCFLWDRDGSRGLRLSDLCSTTNRSDDELRDSPNFS